MQTPYERRRETGKLAEAIAAAKLEAQGFTVTNLNTSLGNCPFADLLARSDDTRVLVQVKGTRTLEGKFGARPERVKALADISRELGCFSVFALVRLVPALETVRFASAGVVHELAKQAEAEYKGVNRYHLSIDQCPEELVRSCLT